ncbi:MAG: hypothetical protein HY928_11430 [Elusimicrobia bacterium]|nr:hypothetical protein [Elusimicrobiota bacterium]
MSSEAALLLCLLALPSWAVEDDAARLLREALDPPAVSYSGTVSVTEARSNVPETRWLNVRYAPPGRSRRETLDRFGTVERLVVSDAETEWVWDRRLKTAWQGGSRASARPFSDPEEELALLLDNYEVRRAGEDTVAGRPCRVLEVSPRRGGAPAQTLCVDAEEGVVLRRAVFAPDGSEAFKMSFETIDLSVKPAASDFRFKPPAGTRVLKARPAPDALELEEAAGATGMLPRPPDWVPPGYVFESVSVLPYKGATLLHYRWSDGVDALSMFQSPARTRIRPPAGSRPRRTKVGAAQAGLSLLADGKSLEWSAGDRFVLMGRLSADELRKVAESVPAPKAP